MEKFGLQPPRASNSASRSQTHPPETERSTLVKKLLFLRSLNNLGKAPQVVNATPVAPIEPMNSIVPTEPTNPVVHVAPANQVAAEIENRALVVCTKLPFPISDPMASAVAVAAVAPDTQENVLSIINDPEIVQASKIAAGTELDQNRRILARDVGWVPAQNATPQLASSNAPAVVQPVIAVELGVLGEFGVFGEMDGQKSLGQLDSNRSLEIASTQLTLQPLQPVAGPQSATSQAGTLYASAKEPEQISKTFDQGQTQQPHSFVLLPATLRQQAVPENIKVLPLDRLATPSKPLTTSKVYSTDSMVGPLPNAANFLSQLDFKNDFRYQAAIPVSMVRTTADESGFGPEWMQQRYAWVAPTFPHKPLYFEQPNLERYGRGPKRCIQPLCSGAHFFGSVLLMPYKVLTQHPEERVYGLGNNRPGNVAPYQTRTLIGQSYPFEALRYFEPYSDYK